MAAKIHDNPSHRRICAIVVGAGSWQYPCARGYGQGQRRARDVSRRTKTSGTRRQGMSRALLKLSGSLVHDYATIADDSPSPNRASRARRAATSAGIS